MYTEDDLRQAVASGAISVDAADALRNSVRQTREAPATDEEHFRLINSFNDIFVTIAAVLLLVEESDGWMQLIARETRSNLERGGPRHDLTATRLLPRRQLLRRHQHHRPRRNQ